MQRDLGANDNDWQLKKLQHDSLKTSDKVVEVLRETIEREVLAQAKDYERLFGTRSAQFAEYLNMVAQKLEQHGIQHADVINWLNAIATEGSVPRDYASDLRDSQSKTVPFIPGGPMQDFGQDSLLDRTLTAPPPAPAPINFNSTMPAANNHPVQMPAATPVAPLEVSAPQQSQVSIPRPTQAGQGTSGFAQPQFPNSQMQPTFPAAPQPQTPPPANQLQPQAPQPNFAQPNFSQPAQQPPQVPPASLAITTSQPLPHQTGSKFASMAPAERKDEEKYVFDPFTAWD